MQGKQQQQMQVTQPIIQTVEDHFPEIILMEGIIQETDIIKEVNHMIDTTEITKDKIIPEGIHQTGTTKGVTHRKDHQETTPQGDITQTSETTLIRDQTITMITTETGANHQRSTLMKISKNNLTVI